jgi:hypothetical protein
VRPGGLGALLGVPAREVRGRTLDLADLWGRRARDIAERVAPADGTAERIRVRQRENGACAELEGFSAKDTIEAAAMVTLRGGRVRVGEGTMRSDGSSSKPVIDPLAVDTGNQKGQVLNGVLAPGLLLRLGIAHSPIAVMAGVPGQPLLDLRTILAGPMRRRRVGRAS